MKITKETFKDEAFSEYRKKPVIVGAILMFYNFEVETLEGTMRGRSGDYLVKGVKGEVYPVRKDIFELTYEGFKD